MKARTMKKNIPIIAIIKVVTMLFVVGVCGGMLAPCFAGEHGEEHAVTQEVMQEQQQARGHVAEDAVEHVGENSGHAEHHAPMLTAAKLKDLFWRILNFAVLIFILVKFLAKPIATSLGGRRQEIKDELEAMQARRDEAEQTYKAFEVRLAGMEDELTKLVNKAKAMAEKEKTRILAEAETAAKEIQRQAEVSVQETLAQAKSSLQTEIAEQAVIMAEELIVKNLTKEDQVAITEQYLERVGAVQ
jgi:F-type H+-transporting ATPase subunit b